MNDKFNSSILNSILKFIDKIKTFLFIYPIKIIENLLKLTIIYLSMLSIRSKRIFVFGSWNGNKFADNSKYLYLEASKQSDVKAIWITKDNETYKQLQSENYLVYYYTSLKGIYYQLRAGIYFTCVSRFDVFSLLMGNAININLCHGVPLKKMVYDDHLTNKMYSSKINIVKVYLTNILYFLPNRKEYIVSTSEKITEIYLSAYRKRKDQVLQLGQPRNDVFFDDRLETDGFPFREEHRKIILYMPTHRNEGKNRIKMNGILDFKLLDKYCNENDLIFIIKKHYFHRNEFENLCDFKNIIDISNKDYDSQLLLKYAHILITDYSSCYIDYLLLNRPIIFYYFDFDNYLINDREMYFDYDKVTPGPKVKTFKELYTLLQQMINNNEGDYQNQLKDVKNIFYSYSNQKSVGSNILQYVKDYM